MQSSVESALSRTFLDSVVVKLNLAPADSSTEQLSYRNPCIFIQEIIDETRLLPLCLRVRAENGRK
jgi:hypothetical protein